WDASAPLAHLRHVSLFHLIAAGSCTVTEENGTSWETSTGDIVLMPNAIEHRLWNGQPECFVSGPEIVTEGPVKGVSVVRHGGDGPDTRIVCGFIESAELVTTPLFRTLPSVLIERTRDNPVAGMLASTAREIQLQLDAAHPGAELLLGRLMEMLF